MTPIDKDVATNSKNPNALFLSGLLKALDKVRAIYPMMEITTLECLLVAALDEGTGVLHIGERIGVSKSAASRHVRFLSDRVSVDREGLKLVELRDDPLDYRRKGVYLTPKGHKLLKTIHGYLK